MLFQVVLASSDCLCGCQNCIEKTSQMLMVDLAVPRDIDPKVEMESIYTELMTYKA